MPTIKEIALKVWDSNMIECPPENLTKFAEAFIESYKAELLKEVGEPVAYKHPTLNKTISIYELVHEQPEWVRDKWVAGQKLFTPDQVAAAILKVPLPKPPAIKGEQW